MRRKAVAHVVLIERGVLARRLMKWTARWQKDRRYRLCTTKAVMCSVHCCYASKRTECVAGRLVLCGDSVYSGCS